jgi:hypothetical protein
MKKQLRPLYCTTVLPDEYDIESDMREMVRQANRKGACYVLMDVGKVWGLYRTWKALDSSMKKSLQPESEPSS